MKRSAVDLSVGVFVIIGHARRWPGCPINLGRVDLLGRGRLRRHGGLPDRGRAQVRAPPWRSPGVQIGRVTRSGSRTTRRAWSCPIRYGVKLQDDSIVSIKTKGLIGEKFVQISPGRLGPAIAPNGAHHARWSRRSTSRSCSPSTCSARSSVWGGLFHGARPSHQGGPLCGSGSDPCCPPWCSAPWPPCPAPRRRRRRHRPEPPGRDGAGGHPHDARGEPAGRAGAGPGGPARRSPSWRATGASSSRRSGSGAPRSS